MDAWPKIGAVTLFVEDLEEAKQFYTNIFGLTVAVEEEDAAVFNFGNTLINLLHIKSAPELVGEAMVASRSEGTRFEFTIEVDDVDAKCAELTAKGVQLLVEPVERPWGARTASFRDPGGHVWEIANFHGRSLESVRQEAPSA